MDIFKIFHSSNIAIHVLAGSTALILGVIALISKKGNKLHTKSGNLFVKVMIVIIFTGLLGVFVFQRNSFLLVITVLSAYYTFSGYRTLQTKSNQPKLLDVSVGILSVLTALYFLYFFKKIGFYWSPVTTYATVGALFTIVTYDFCKYLIPKSKYGKLWLYEHIYKMIGAFTALLSAFSGTVFPNYKPYSQVLPSAFGTILAIAFLVYYIRLNNTSKSAK
ncbi:Uncharacterised protein [Sphingobacterium spiritivorum]|uniref:DUF2306 domain-containing protein n=1 Tax=Sphingobacterium spiritivorum TaxID=258 RepID=A0A380BIT8_SPHSI|nr:hypothetical protein [Sphingobacterium spiritivorum]SUJ01288.1 Uncharacterised protein [Sphingobacterium spiritivorum]